jgi:hypothetical protein
LLSYPSWLILFAEPCLLVLSRSRRSVHPWPVTK